VVLDGDRFEPRSFTVSEIAYSQQNLVDQLQIELVHLDKDQDQDEVSILTAAFMAGSVQGDPVNLSLVVLDSNLTIVGDTSFVLFDGVLGAWALDEQMLNITAVSLFDRWAQRTLSHHTPSCRWKVFKGTECKYVGAETKCDRSYTRCTALSNTDNFGGFRWLPSIVDAQIWWGKEAG